MRRVCMAGALAAATTGQAFADEVRPAAKLSQMFPMLDDYLDLPESERSHFELEFRVLPADPELEEFGLWLESGGDLVPLRLSEHGLVDISQLGKYADEDPMVMTDLPKGGGKTNLTSSPKLELDTEIPISDLKTAIDQANRAIASQAGLMSFAAPKMKKVAFSLAPDTQVSLRYPGGKTETLEPNGTAIVIRPSRKTREAVLVFSPPPLDDAFKD